MTSTPVKESIRYFNFSADCSTKPNWDQTSRGISCLESESENLDSNSETVASNSEGKFDRYLDINKNNSAVLDISHSCLVFPWSCDGIFMRKYHRFISENFL